MILLLHSIHCTPSLYEFIDAIMLLIARSKALYHIGAPLFVTGPYLWQSAVNMGGKFPYVYTYCSILMMYCFSTGLHTKVAKTPLSLLVLNAEDNSPPGDLTIFFAKLLISWMRLCQVMRNWFSTCLVCQVLLTAEVVS